MQAALVTVLNSGQCEAFWQGSALWRGLSSTTLTQAPAGSSGGRFRLWVCKPVGNPGKASGSSGSSGGRHRLWVYGASGQPWKGPSCLCRDQDQASAFPDPTHGLSVCLGSAPGKLTSFASEWQTGAPAKIRPTPFLLTRYC